METGTGKTVCLFAYDIGKLNKEHGFKKFMIVVPSVAIRKGVEKSIEQLRSILKDYIMWIYLNIVLFMTVII